MAESSYFARLAARLMTSADLLTPPHQLAFHRGQSFTEHKMVASEGSSSHSSVPVTEQPQEGQRSEPPGQPSALGGNLEPRFGPTQVAPHDPPGQPTDHSDSGRPAVSRFSTHQDSFALPQTRLTPAGLRNRDADRVPSSTLAVTMPAHFEPTTGNQPGEPAAGTKPDEPEGMQRLVASGTEADKPLGMRQRLEMAQGPVHAEMPKTQMRSDASSDVTGLAPNIDRETRPFHRGGSVESPSPQETHPRPLIPDEEPIVSTGLVGSPLRPQPMVASPPQETKPIVQIGSIEVVVASPPRPAPSIPTPTPQLPASHPLSHGFSWGIGLRQS